MAKYTKIEIALHHFNKGLDAYMEGDLLTALHCAGAAEEIAGDLLTNEKKQNAFDELAILQTSLGLSNEPLKPKLNETKNGIKHADKDPDAIVEIDEIDCVFRLLMAGLNIMRTEHKSSLSIFEKLGELKQIGLRTRP